MTLRQLCRTEGNGDQMLALRALDLFSRELVIALEALLAMGTGEFELTHNLGVLIFIDIRNDGATADASLSHANLYAKWDQTSRKKWMSLLLPESRIVW